MAKKRESWKSNKSPHIKPSAQFASSYSTAREDEERFETTQRGNRRRNQKKLDKGEH